jgi:hypothetical protein
MTDGPTTSLPLVDGDDAFQRAHAKNVLEFATHFDVWVARALAPPRNVLEGAGTFADHLQVKHEVGFDAIRESIDLVYDLAKLCRRFVIRDLLAWVELRRREGVSVDNVVQAASTRAREIMAETYHRKWQLGLRGTRNPWEPQWFFARSALPDLVDAPISDQSADAEAWKIVVEESVTDFVENMLHSFLIDHSRAREMKIAKAKAASEAAAQRASDLGREAVEVFRLKVLSETGHKVTKEQIALVAGYMNTTELHRFQRNDKRLTKAGLTAITRTLQLESAEFLDRLKKRQLATKAGKKRGG